ncbi:PspC domain-containing protein [Catellatospora vulcania]|uniref:PspC domain-containing protein n=1 Tax=Catellatospora vulcania TaxID=1460450 RepID=UPI0018AFC529|nr:PspC domain-containing protein [Catellatospora vulcania]
MTDETPAPPGAVPSAEAPPAAQAPPPPQGEPSSPYVSWAAPYGLIRPRHGRYLAGVCGALGRATKTDPLLWRVLIGVLSVFGVGIVIYLAAWLLTPAEGDSSSPVEALFGRGYSGTSSTLTLVIGVLTVIMIGAVTNSFEVAVIAAIGLVIAALVVSRNTVGGQPPRSRPGATYLPPDYAAAPVTVPAAAPMPSAVTVPVPPVDPAGYRAPFAPHGPYAPAAPPPPPLPPKPLKIKREPSRLGRLIFGLAMVALGGLAMIDMTGRSVPGSLYVAAALGVVGFGLVIGAWFGRARGYILIGIVLALALPMVAATGDWSRERTQAGSVTWMPTTMEELHDRYEHRFGEATLDLSGLDLTGKDVQVTAQITGGDLRVILPPDTDVTVVTKVNLADADVFGRSISGAGQRDTQTSLGDDGKPGPGKLHLVLDVNLGHAEVVR